MKADEYKYRDAFQFTYEWQPTLPVKLVAADKREFYFPTVGTWLADQAKRDPKVFKNSTLNRKQCKDLWRWLGRKDQPPSKLWVYISREAIDRVLHTRKPGTHD